MAAFTAWCAVHAQTALPASPETVAAFLAAEAGSGLAVNTLRLRHAALRYLHLLAGLPLPTASPLVSATFAGIRRAHRRPLAKKTALVVEPLRRALTAIPDTLPGLRDRALLLVGFAAALRPSELSRLDMASLTRHEDGIALFLPWRKNDQEAQGTTVWLPVGKTDLCPVIALETWLAAAAIAEGPLFRRLWRLPPPRVRKGANRKSIADHYRIGANPIDTDSIALVVKKWTGLAGLDGAAGRAQNPHDLVLRAPAGPFLDDRGERRAVVPARLLALKAPVAGELGLADRLRESRPHLLLRGDEDIVVGAAGRARIGRARHAPSHLVAAPRHGLAKVLVIAQADPDQIDHRVLHRHLDMLALA